MCWQVLSSEQVVSVINWDLEGPETKFHQALSNGTPFFSFTHLAFGVHGTPKKVTGKKHAKRPVVVLGKNAKIS